MATEGEEIFRCLISNGYFCPSIFRTGRTVLPDTQKALACHFQSDLHVLHVLDLRIYGMFGLGMDESTACAFAPDQRIGAESELSAFRAEDLQGLSVKQFCLSEIPSGRS